MLYFRIYFKRIHDNPSPRQSFPDNPSRTILPRDKSSLRQSFPTTILPRDNSSLRQSFPTTILRHDIFFPRLSSHQANIINIIQYNIIYTAIGTTIRHRIRAVIYQRQFIKGMFFQKFIYYFGTDNSSYKILKSIWVNF